MNLTTLNNFIEIIKTCLIGSYTLKILPYVNFYRVISDKILNRSYKISIQQKWIFIL